jgi:hypothetical protein
MTPHGRVEASFWTISNRPSGRFSPDVAIAPSGRELAARVVLNPIDPEKCSTRVVFDFTPHLYLSANISYQAMILNDSEVFEIVASGQVRTLIETLEKGAASLTDRDQQGRSLLSVSCHPSSSFQRLIVHSMLYSIDAQICANFLLIRRQTSMRLSLIILTSNLLGKPNLHVSFPPINKTIPPSMLPLPLSVLSPSSRSPFFHLTYDNSALTHSSPVHGGINSLDSEYEEPERLGRAECMKIMLQAEADFSLETYEGDGVWRNTFMNAVSGGSFVSIAVVTQL